MIKKEITLYNFNELSKEVQKKVIKRFQEKEEHFFLSDDMKETLKELLKENNIKGEAKLYYSLSHSQGDGVCFVGEFEYKDVTLYITHRGHYYHSNSVIIEAQETKNLGYHIDEEEPLYKQVQEFEVIYQTICKKLEKFGYGCIESDLEESNIIDNIEANGYTFRDSGEIENI